MFVRIKQRLHESLLGKLSYRKVLGVTDLAIFVFSSRVTVATFAVLKERTVYGSI